MRQKAADPGRIRAWECEGVAGAEVSDVKCQAKALVNAQIVGVAET